MTLTQKAIGLSAIAIALSSAYTLAGSVTIASPTYTDSNASAHFVGEKPAKQLPHNPVQTASKMTQGLSEQPALNAQTSPSSSLCGTDTNNQNWHQLQVTNKHALSQNASKAQSRASTLSSAQVTQRNALIDQGEGEPGRYYIPVVVHVYGDEYNCDDAASTCLTEEKIIAGLNQTTEDFRGLNQFDGPIADEFKAIRANLDIEFVLAKLDPNGNPTNGIVRYETGAGYGHWADFNQAIADDSWDNFKYMNIYIQHDLYNNGATNNSGVAWYPEQGMSAAGTARVVYNGHYFGDNTNENFRSVFTHEFGHWLNLPHTFEGGSCSIHQAAFCEATGDNNCDTPQISLSSLQNNFPNCLGQATNTENFMHYSDNYAMYTQGQVNRMTAALHGPVRANLWSNSNLIDTGLVQLTSHVEHVWDGSGADYVPQGELLEQYTPLSATLGDIDHYEITIPQGTEAVAFYLDGFSEDPDLYVSKGSAPYKNGDTWIADFISFQATGTPELVAITSPASHQNYHTAIDAFSAYSNATFSIIAVDDSSLCEGCERIFLADDSLSGTQGETPLRYQFAIPTDAINTTVVLPGGYQGDPDLFVAINSAPTLEQYHCRPYMSARLSELCIFGADARGNTLEVMVDPFSDYSATLQVYYERQLDSTLPVAEANGGYYAAIDESIAFSSAGSTDFDGHIVSYLWDFGDGTNSVDANPTHSYHANGNYTATLTVTDNDNHTATDTAMVGIKIANVAPTVQLTHPDSAVTGASTPFSSAGSDDSDGRIVSYLWDFGDGMVSNAANPSHVFINAGQYSISLTVTDNEGLSTLDSSTVTILDPAPVPLMALTPIVNRTDWGVTQFNRSVYQNPLTIAGVTYDTGIGTHAYSELVYPLDGQYSTFTTTIGLDDEVGTNGSVVFQILLDDQLAFSSGTMTGGQSQQVQLAILGSKTLTLQVLDAGDGISWDHADWAAPTLSRALPLSLTYFPAESISSGWGTTQVNRSIAGNPLSIEQQIYSEGFGTHAISEMVFDLNAQYQRFSSIVGVDDEGNDGSSVSFEVYVDGVLAFDSGVLTLADGGRVIDIDVQGAHELKLIATDGGDGNYADHADWAEPRLVK
ncbi:NPCBM/NEW2 domain-containing protein [Shewanella sp. UCD-KL12]|uniref:NPCBM/NEW2 domain-containing protein n=1 Tax=Shewanella sp. UCD-KL12 TaxID=1917163 RepID=UPI000970A9C3|nr:NPCBM/NEW2 domain-containing protein [Shewanella sp. UCD-KL12]